MKAIEKDLRNTFSHEVSTIFTPLFNKNYHILVVDDHRINQIIIKKILELNGINYKLADNGFQALNLMKNNDFDLILMDLIMPVMNGIVTTKRIKELYPGVPVIAVTTLADKISTNALTENGFKAILKKPVNKNFLETLKHLLTPKPTTLLH